MEFTRERLYPELTPDQIKFVLYEHLARYDFACQYVKDQRVLDAACGSGYGSKILLEKGKANEIHGVDISFEAIRGAKKKYRLEGLQYRIGDVTKLNFEDQTYDVVVSFETIEHIPDGKLWLAEAHRVLKDDGLLIISTPHRELSSPGRPRAKPLHPFHCFEYTQEEFLEELEELFSVVEVYGQSLHSMWKFKLTSKMSNWKWGKRLLSWWMKRRMLIQQKILQKNTWLARSIEKRWQKQARVCSIKGQKLPYYIIAICRKKSAF